MGIKGYINSLFVRAASHQLRAEFISQLRFASCSTASIQSRYLSGTLWKESLSQSKSCAPFALAEYWIYGVHQINGDHGVELIWHPTNSLDFHRAVWKVFKSMVEKKGDKRLPKMVSTDYVQKSSDWIKLTRFVENSPLSWMNHIFLITVSQGIAIKITIIQNLTLLVRPIIFILVICTQGHEGTLHSPKPLIISLVAFKTGDSPQPSSLRMSSSKADIMCTPPRHRILQPSQAKG